MPKSLAVALTVSLDHLPIDPPDPVADTQGLVAELLALPADAWAWICACWRAKYPWLTLTTDPPPDLWPQDQRATLRRWLNEAAGWLAAF